MKQEKFSIKKRLESFKYACQGLGHVIWREHNFRIHILAAIIAIAASIYFDINPFEWIFISMAIILVFAAEMFNTAIEKLTDIVSPEINPKAGKIKDIAAGAVLLTALFSLIVAGIIFIPRILELF